jgi:hypothetical protein
MANLKKYLELIELAKSDIREIIKLEDIVKADYTQELMKESGGSRKLKRYKIVKKYLDNCKKHSAKRPAFHNIFYDDIRNVSVVCNGYSMHVLNDDRFKDLESPEALAGITYTKLIPEFKTSVKINIDSLIPEIKLQSKLSTKQKQPYIIKFTDTCHYAVNPEYLLTAIELLELSGEIEVFLDLGKNINPLVFKNDLGLSMILPIRYYPEYAIPGNPEVNKEIPE